MNNSPSGLRSARHAFQQANIAPTTHPSSSCLFPNPPKRQLPPAPLIPFEVIDRETRSLTDSIRGDFGDEPQYAEAKPALIVLDFHGESDKIVIESSLCPDNFGSLQQNTFSPADRNGYAHNHADYEISLDQHAQNNGTCFIPSGATTLSSECTSRIFDRSDKQTSPGTQSFFSSPAQTSAMQLPVTANQPHGSKIVVDRSGKVVMVKDSPSLLDSWFVPIDASSMSFSWKCLSFLLAFILLVCLAVITYLLVCAFAQPAMDASSLGECMAGDSSPSDAACQPTTSRKSGRPFPATFPLGDEILADLAPGSTRTIFALERDSYVQFNITVDSPSAKLVIYGRSGFVASPAENDFSHVILGLKLHLRPVAQHLLFNRNSRVAMFQRFLSAGRWHLTLLNDDAVARTIHFYGYLASSSLEENCKYDCMGKGVCANDRCICFSGYHGKYCEENTCPVLCSGNGIYVAGKCHCDENFKGAECDIPSNFCQSDQCNGHGYCGPNGICVCDAGFAGEFCNEATCLDSTCNTHGVCSGGICYCEFGWSGTNCERMYTSTGLCSSYEVTEICSGHGRLRKDEQCECSSGFVGANCEQRTCLQNCGSHGRCVNGSCICDDGFFGAGCEQRHCLPGCDEVHGHCVNGSCVCNRGYNGAIACQFDGCPNNCSGHGDCVKNEDGAWACRCASPDFAGADCGSALELICDDAIDNDDDGLVDCEDSECCGASSVCESNSICQTVPDPNVILLRKQAPSSHASFFQKIRFLLEANSVQQYADISVFAESQVSILRGRVLDVRGNAVIGARVTDDSNVLGGFTLSRANGVFDLVVNGGGFVLLAFMRKPFASVKKSFSVPWNQIGYVGDIILTAKTHPSLQPSKRSTDEKVDACERLHDARRLFATMLSSHRFSRLNGLSSANAESRVLADSQIVQQSVTLPGSHAFLVYSSGNQLGFLSTLQLRLVGDFLPASLRFVKLRVDIEGNRFEQDFEARANFSHTFAWNRRNVYRQKVFGISSAKVSVGYVYSGCGHIFWQKQTARMPGFTSTISDIAGWNLNVHNYFDIQSGTLEKGDGSVSYFIDEPFLLRTLIGSSRQRQLQCSACNDDGDRRNLFLPMALTTGKDGTIFVGDYNLIRRLQNDTLVTVLELSFSDTSHKYYLATNPLTGDVFISLPLRRQIWRIRNAYGTLTSPPSMNYEIISGTGQPCFLSDSCGDGGPAQTARLSFPKGLTFTSNGVLLFADERKLRQIDANGMISSVIGGRANLSTHWRPLPCKTEFNLNELLLQWPTDVAYDNTNSAVVFVDNDKIFSFRQHRRVVELLAGIPADCEKLLTPFNYSVRPLALNTVQALTVSPFDGAIYLSEVDTPYSASRLRRFDGAQLTDVEIARSDAGCACDRSSCPCEDDDDARRREITRRSSSSARLSLPVSLTISPDGVLHIADQSSYKVQSLVVAAPKLRPASQLYEIASTLTQELYGFNRFGKHVWTKDLLTDRILYNFTYHIDTSYGKMITVSTSIGAIHVLRRSANHIQMHNTATDTKLNISVDHFGMLEQLTYSSGKTVRFSYYQNTGLMLSRDEAGFSWLYEFNEYGQLTNAVLPASDFYSFRTQVSVHGFAAVLQRNGVPFLFEVSDEAISSNLTEDGLSVVSGQADSFVLSSSANSIIIQYDSLGTHSAARDFDQHLVGWRRKVTLPELSSPARNELIHKSESRYSLRLNAHDLSKRRGQVFRKIRLNGLGILSVEFDHENNCDTIRAHDGVSLLSIYYDSSGRPVRYVPASDALASSNLTFDLFGRITSARWGALFESFAYDHHGRLIQFERGGNATQTTSIMRYEYKDGQPLPSTVQLASSTKFVLEYDGSGDLRTIVTPSGLEHRYLRQRTLAGMNYLYFAPNSASPLILQKDLPGNQVRRIYWPDLLNRVTFRYDVVLDRLLSIATDNSVTRIRYVGKTNAIRQLLVDAIAVSFATTNEYQAETLLIESVHRATFTVSGTPHANNVVHFVYHYDNNFRLISLNAAFNGVAIESVKLVYDSATGRLTNYHNYAFSLLAMNKLRIVGRNLVIERVYGPERQLLKDAYYIQDQLTCELSYVFDFVGRLKQINAHVLQDSFLWRYEYNADQFLTAAVIDGTHTWAFKYNADGQLMSINNRSLGYDTHGHIERYGDVKYRAEIGGFVTRRGQTLFTYDGLGRLTRARSLDSTHRSVAYFYDHQNRLIARKSANDNKQTSAGETVTYFYYALPNKAHLLTHLLETPSGLLTTFYYDRFDVLFAMEHDNSVLFVVSTFAGSPLFVFSNGGDLLKRVVYSPFGEIIVDSNSEFMLPIGFKGAFHDVEVGVVIFSNGRPYDPSIGHFLSSPPELYFAIDAFDPTSALNLNNGYDSVNLRPPLKTDITDWLIFMGYSLENLVPPLHGESVLFSMCSSDSSILLATLCSLHQGAQHFENRLFQSSAKLSALFPQETKPKPSMALSVFSEGVFLSNTSGSLELVFASWTNKELRTLLSVLLNKAQLVPLTFVDDQHRTTHHFVNDGVAVREVLPLFRINGSGATSVTLAFDRLKINVSTDAPDAEKRIVELRLDCDYQSLHVRFDTTLEQETTRLLQLAQERASKLAWLNELELAVAVNDSAGRGSFAFARDFWTADELRQLKSAGVVAGYRAEFWQLVDEFPEQSDNPNWLTFVKDV